MKPIQFKTSVRKLLADMVTPVSVYLRVRSLYPKSILLESSDYRGEENALSLICFSPIAHFQVQNNEVSIKMPESKKETYPVSAKSTVEQQLDQFLKSFQVEKNDELPVNGIFGYISYDAVKYFEKIEIKADQKPAYQIPEIHYSFYQYTIVIDHHTNELFLIEYLQDDEKSQLDQIEHLLVNLNFMTSRFELDGDEGSNIDNQQYMDMVTRGKEHCYRGDVFQIVLSRQFSQSFKGDDFNVYRALRQINPSPYLFYFDYDDFKIMGSSPEAELRIKEGRAIIHPIAGTFKRTGNDEEDRKLAEKLCEDPKENAEHVMLVDLARNDLSRNADDVKVDIYREVQYYSHVIHLVSEVSGRLPKKTNIVSVLGDSFPAGTLSGAPKHRAMQLIDHYENQRRGYYGGCIGYLGFDGTLNHAIMIRSFLSKDDVLYYQAGAGVVADSKEESELQEVNNKLGALKKAIEMAKDI